MKLDNFVTREVKTLGVLLELRYQNLSKHLNINLHESSELKYFLLG